MIYSQQIKSILNEMKYGYISYNGVSIVKEVLKKQIPKKPIKLSMSDDGHHMVNCPICKHQFYETDKILYCQNCGQAIDWSKE